MVEYPSFNYKTVYFFWLSLFGIIFVFSLLDLIKVKNTDVFFIISFINIAVAVFSWIYQISLNNAYKKYIFKHQLLNSELIADMEWYNKRETLNLIVTSIIIYGLTLIAIFAQI